MNPEDLPRPITTQIEAARPAEEWSAADAVLRWRKFPGEWQADGELMRFTIRANLNLATLYQTARDRRAPDSEGEELIHAGTLVGCLRTADIYEARDRAVLANGGAK